MRPLRTLLSLDGRPGAALVGLAALGSFAVQGFVWPLAAGRDWQDYVIWWHEAFRDEPLFPSLMIARAPLAPLVYGPVLQVGGAHLAEVVAGVLYAAAVVLWTATARFHGRLAAIALAALLVVPPTYGLFFRQVGSDPVFGLVLALAAWLCAPGRPQRRRAGEIRARRRERRRSRCWRDLLALPLLLLVLLPLVVGRSWRTQAHARGSRSSRPPSSRSSRTRRSTRCASTTSRSGAVAAPGSRRTGPTSSTGSWSGRTARRRGSSRPRSSATSSASSRTARSA